MKSLIVLPIPKKQKLLGRVLNPTALTGAEGLEDAWDC